MCRTLIPWQSVETVLLDLDGTLLDLHFDNHFWLEHVPKHFALARGIEITIAKEAIYPRYRAAYGTLDWYSVDYWSSELELDIATLKEEIAHLIALRPFAMDFLNGIKQLGKRVVLLTNAHPKSLSLKFSRIDLTPYFDAMMVSHDLAPYPKEHPEFWPYLQKEEPFHPAATLLIDDSLAVLRTAMTQGIAYLLAIRQPDSQRTLIDTQEFVGLNSFQELLSAIDLPTQKTLWFPT